MLHGEASDMSNGSMRRLFRLTRRDLVTLHVVIAGAALLGVVLGITTRPPASSIEPVPAVAAVSYPMAVAEPIAPERPETPPPKTLEIGQFLTAPTSPAARTRSDVGACPGCPGSRERDVRVASAWTALIATMPTGSGASSEVAALPQVSWPDTGVTYEVTWRTYAPDFQVCAGRWRYAEGRWVVTHVSGIDQTPAVMERLPAGEWVPALADPVAHRMDRWSAALREVADMVDACAAGPMPGWMWTVSGQTGIHGQRAGDPIRGVARTEWWTWRAGATDAWCFGYATLTSAASSDLRGWSLRIVPIEQVAR